MPGPTSSPRIFLSYARSDRDYAIALRDELKAAGLPVWHDLQDLEAGQWWSQIAGVLDGRSIEHIVLIASPDAQASKVVAQECWLAQREGKTASLVVPPQHVGKIVFKKLPRFMQAAHHYSLSEPDQKAKFIEGLRKPGQGPRRPRPEGRPKLADYVARAKEYGLIKAALLDADGEATTAMVVLHGHGGFGKTTLATAFVNDEAVQQAYFNGILLVELGEGLAKLPKSYDGRKSLEGLIKAKIEVLIKTLTDQDERLDELDAAKARLKEVLDHRHGAVLLWIDDAWDAEHAKHFTEAAPTAAKLITTRIRDILPEATARVDVDELTDTEAAAFMGWSLQSANATERTGLGELATVTAGRWPILIRQINAQLRYQTTAQSGRKAQALGDAITLLRTRLRREGLDDLDKSTDSNRATAVRLSVGVSFDMLREEDRYRKYPEGFHEKRYLDLAGFQEAEVPIATIARLWGHLGVLRRAQAPTLDARSDGKLAEQEGHWRAELREESIAILERLYALALLQKLDAGDTDGMVRLHDVMRQYLADKQKDAMQAFHEQFVLAYAAESREAMSEMTERERRYFYTWYPTHLAKADESEVLEALLLDPRWMRRKLEALGNVHQLLADYRAFAQSRPLQLVRDALGLGYGPIGRDPRHLEPQLIGRIHSHETPKTAETVRIARQIAKLPALLPRSATLTQSNQGQVARLDGRGGAIRCICSIGNTRIATGSSNGAVQVFDIASSIEVEKYELNSSIWHVSSLDDATLAVATDDNIFLCSNGSVDQLPLGHEKTSITSLAALPNSEIIYSTGPVLWRWRSDREKTSSFLLEEKHKITSISFLSSKSPDQFLAIGLEVAHPLLGIVRQEGRSDVKVYDIADEKCRLKSHIRNTLTAEIRSIVDFPSKRGNLIAVAGGSLSMLAHDEMGTGITVYNVDTGQRLAELSGHTRSVAGLAIVANNSERPALASASWDGTVRLWNIDSLEEFLCLEGHDGAIQGITAIHDDQAMLIATAGFDNSIRIWDIIKAGVSNPRQSHRGVVSAIAAHKGVIASVTGAYRKYPQGQSDGTIRVWDGDSGSLIRVIPAEDVGGVGLSFVPARAGGVHLVADRQEELAFFDIALGQIATTRRVGGSIIELPSIGYLFAAVATARSGRNFVQFWSYVVSGRRQEVGLDSVRAWNIPASIVEGRDNFEPWFVCSPIGNGLTLYRIRSGEEVKRAACNYRVSSIASLKKEKFVTISADGDRLTVWALPSLTIQKEVEIELRQQKNENSVPLSVAVDENTVLAAPGDRTIRLIEIASGIEVASFEFDAIPTAIHAYEQGCRLAIGDWNGKVHLIDVVKPESRS